LLQQFDDSEDEEGSEDEARRKWQEQEAAVSKTWVFKHVLLIRHAWYASPLAAGTPLGRDLGPWDDEDDVPLSLYLDHDKVHQTHHPTAVVIMPHVVPAVFSTQQGPYLLSKSLLDSKRIVNIYYLIDTNSGKITISIYQIATH
jgi:hypothetical protein